MNECGIYSIFNTANGKQIIGQSKNITKRWYFHRDKLRKNIHHNPYLQNAWNKYGEHSFQLKIILLCPVENLDQEEIRLIKENKTMDRNFGYNVMNGGNRPQHSEETKLKMSNIKKLLYKNKENHPRLGKKLSEGAKQNISLGHQNPSEETRLKMRISHLGKKPSDETRLKMSLAQQRKILSTEHKKKIGEANRKRFLEKQATISP
jgi:group I intron endonuclease